jgi:hypothetical protein
VKKSKLNWANVKKNLTALKLFPVFLIVFGAFGLFASGAIAVEKEHLLKNPETELVCNLNPIYSCSNVFLSKQSQAFGVSNELSGHSSIRSAYYSGGYAFCWSKNEKLALVYLSCRHARVYGDGGLVLWPVSVCDRLTVYILFVRMVFGLDTHDYRICLDLR